MKNITKFSVVAVLAIALTQSLQAIPITGNIGFTGLAVLNNTSAGNATGVTSWSNTSVLGTTGGFTVAPNGTPATFTPNWLFAAGLNPLWTVFVNAQNSFTFNLTSSAITSQIANTSVTVNGSGLVTGLLANVPITATPMNFSFTTQDPSVTTNPRAWTFSASTTSVPDGGATIAILGMALVGLEGLRRKLRIA